VRPDQQWPPTCTRGERPASGLFHSSSGPVGVQGGPPSGQSSRTGRRGRRGGSVKSQGTSSRPRRLSAKHGARSCASGGGDGLPTTSACPKNPHALVEGYRRIRNTCRYLLGTSDSQGGRGAAADLLPSTVFILHRLQRLVERCARAYEEYEFHILYHACTISAP